MVDTEPLDKIIEREYAIKSLLETKKCILEIQPNSIVKFCSNYGTEICNNSSYRNQCSYSKEQDSKK